jgi:hypothetical protein
MSPARESRPAGNQAAEMFSGGNAISLPATTDRTTAAALVTGVHVVVVETSGGKHRRRVYLTLNSAQLAADRAVMAGHSAHIILCQLTPVAGGEL